MSKFIESALEVAQTHVDARDLLMDTPDVVLSLILSDALIALHAENEKLKKESELNNE